MNETEFLAPGVVKVARDLTEIEKCAAALEGEVIHRGAARLMPGGAAMVALGPDADLDEWAERIAAAELRHFDGPHSCPKADHHDCVVLGAEHVEDEDDQDHEDPLRTLLFWSEAWREEHGYPLDGRTPTLLTEARFVRHFLDYAWATEPQWDDFAADVNRVRVRLENLLHAGSRQNRMRVVCLDTTHADAPADERPRLIKIYAPAVVVAWSCHTCGARTAEIYRCADCKRRWPPPFTGDTRCPGMVGKKTDRQRCEGRIVATLDAAACPTCGDTAPPTPVQVSRPEDDAWKCTSCKRRYDAEQYQDAYAKQLRSSGADRYVPIRDALATLRAQGRAERTIRHWLAPPKREPVDQCTECRALWPRQEYPACPAEIKDRRTGEVAECGGELQQAFIGDDPDGVVEGYCDLVTRRTFVWWPTLWRRHLTRTTGRGGDRRSA